MRWLRRFVIGRALRMVSCGQALDVGCGPGGLVIAMARRAPELTVTGVDLAAEMVVQAEENARRAGVSERSRFRQGDAVRLPFADGAFDLVVSTLSLHHWSDPVAVLREIGRVTRPGGVFLVFDLRRDISAPIYLFLWFITHVIVPSPLRRIGEPLGSRNASYTPPEAAALAEQAGLRGWRVATGLFWLTVEGRRPLGESRA